MRIKRALIYIDEHPGLPTAVMVTVLLSWLVLYINHSVSLCDEPGFFVLFSYFTVVFMVAWLGWEFDSLIAALSNEDDWWRDYFGQDTWVVVYLVESDHVYFTEEGAYCLAQCETIEGAVEMSKEQAMDWGCRSRSSGAVGIKKKRGAFRHFVGLKCK
jgi:hypothetical protein